MTLLANEGQACRMEALGKVNRHGGTVSERRADPPEVVEMLVTDDQSLDPALLQQAVYALLREAAIHPVGVPAGVEQQAAHLAIGRLGLQERRETGSVVRVQGAERRPRDSVLVGLGTAGGPNVVKHGSGVEPASFGDAQNAQTLEGADVECGSNAGHGAYLANGQPLSLPSLQRQSRSLGANDGAKRCSWL